MRMFLSILMILLCAWGTFADELQYRIGPFTMDPPNGTCEVQALSANAWSVTWPQGAEYQDVKLEMIVVTVDQEASEAMKAAEVRVYDNTLTTYLGLSGEAETINKALFMGGTEPRTVYQSTVPRPHTAHVFAKDLGEHGFVMVGIRDFEPDSEACGDLIRQVGDSFRFNPEAP